VILLIGIVKKNAIMMIDFALDAQRQQGRSTHDAIFEACVAALPPDHDDDHGGAPRRRAARHRLRLRRRAAPAARHLDHRGLVLSQLLTLYTTPVVYLYLDRLRLRILRRRAVQGPA
jgi:multidrug efflux pump